MKTAGLYSQAEVLRNRLGSMRLTDLLALNPTLDDLHHILELAYGSSGAGSARQEECLQWVNALFASREPKLKLQEDKRASRGKFRLLLLIDSEQYQLGEDQDTKAGAARLYLEYGKRHPACIYDDHGVLMLQMGD